MWLWLNFGDSQVGIAQGLIRGADAGAFAQASELARVVREEGDAIRAEAGERAQQLLQEAHAEAHRIVAQAQEQSQAIAEAALRDGERRGLAEAANRWHRRRLEETLDRAGALAAQRDVMARIVTTSIERIIRSESPRGLFEKALAQVGDLLRDASSATLRIHPDDREAARRAIDDAGSSRLPGCPVELVCDAAASPGTCRFESELGVLDASLEVQLESLRMAIGEACARSAASMAEEAGPAHAAAPAAAGAGLPADQYDADDDDENDREFEDDMRDAEESA